MKQLLTIASILILMAPTAEAFIPNPTTTPPDGTWENPYRPDNCALASNGNPVECPYGPMEDIKYSFNVAKNRVLEAWYDPFAVDGFKIDIYGGAIINIHAPQASPFYLGDGLAIKIEADIFYLNWNESIQFSDLRSFEIFSWSSLESNINGNNNKICFSCSPLPSNFFIGLTFSHDLDSTLASLTSSDSANTTLMTWTSISLASNVISEPSASSIILLGILGMIAATSLQPRHGYRCALYSRQSQV